MIDNSLDAINHVKFYNESSIIKPLNNDLEIQKGK